MTCKYCCIQHTNERFYSCYNKQVICFNAVIRLDFIFRSVSIIRSHLSNTSSSVYVTVRGAHITCQTKILLGKGAEKPWWTTAVDKQMITTVLQNEEVSHYYRQLLASYMCLNSRHETQQFIIHTVMNRNNQ